MTELAYSRTEARKRKLKSYIGLPCEIHPNHRERDYRMGSCTICLSAKNSPKPVQEKKFAPLHTEQPTAPNPFEFIPEDKLIAALYEIIEDIDSAPLPEVLSVQAQVQPNVQTRWYKKKMIKDLAEIAVLAVISVVVWTWLIYDFLTYTPTINH